MTLRHTHNVQMANRWYRPKRQPLKVLNLFRKAWRDHKGTQDDPLLVSFFPLSSPSSIFNLLICIILKIIDCCTILENYYFLWQNYSEYHILSLNSSFHLPISWCLLSTPPKKKIKVGPIIRIILVPPLASVNLRGERSQRGSRRGGGLSPLSQKPIPLSPQMKWHFLQGSMESRQFESRSVPAPVGAPHFENTGYAPAKGTDQNIIEFEHGHKRQLLSRSTKFMVYLLYITCKHGKPLICNNALICNSRFNLGIDSK